MKILPCPKCNADAKPLDVYPKLIVYVCTVCDNLFEVKRGRFLDTFGKER